MKSSNRLLAYILLNIIISALTTLTVLWFWERANPRPEVPAPSGTAAASVPTATIPAAGPTIPTLSPDQAVVTIENVIGVGNLADEYVLIKSQSDGSLVLTNWQLDDGQGSVYTFPDLTLNQGGAVQVHTRAGANTVIDLYWGRDEAVWRVDKEVRLLDPTGSVRSTYRVR